MSSPVRNKARIAVADLVICAMFGSLMYATTYVMKALPNVHLLGMFIVTLTVVYRAKALIPLYIYVFLEGLFMGFSLWWVPYLYIWTVLWGVTMLLPRNMPAWLAAAVYPLVSGLHGLCFGLLFAPAQVLLFFGGDFSKFWPWVAAGIGFDITHAIGNVASGLLILPMVLLLRKLQARYAR